MLDEFSNDTSLNSLQYIERRKLSEQKKTHFSI